MRILPNPPQPVNDHLALAIGNDNTLLFKAQKNYRLSLTPQKLQALKARNEKLLSRFAPADMERDDQ